MGGKAKGDLLEISSESQITEATVAVNRDRDRVGGIVCGGRFERQRRNLRVADCILTVVVSPHLRWYAERAVVPFATSHRPETDPELIREH